jgi:uncharacterized protein YbbC (DUF1343 family)
MQDAFDNLKLPAVITHRCSYKPGFGYINEKCYGLQLEISDSSSFRPVRTGLELIKLIASLYPDPGKERFYKTIASPTGEKHLDKLTGVCNSFERIRSQEMIGLGLNVANGRKLLLLICFTELLKHDCNGHIVCFFSSIWKKDL